MISSAGVGPGPALIGDGLVSGHRMVNWKQCSAKYVVSVNMAVLDFHESVIGAMWYPDDEWQFAEKSWGPYVNCLSVFVKKLLLDKIRIALVHSFASAHRELSKQS